MRVTRVKVGLWVRMAIATILATLGLGLLLVVEFAFTAFTALIFYYLLVPNLDVVLGIVALGAVGFGCWWLAAVIYEFVVPDGFVSERASHVGVRLTLERIGYAFATPRRTVRPRTVGLVGLVMLSVFAGYTLFERPSAITPMRLSIAVGIVVVGYHFAHLVHSEWTNDSAVLETLEEAAMVSDSDSDFESDERGSTDGLPDTTGSDETTHKTLQARVDRLAQQADVPPPTVRLGSTGRPIAATVGYRPSNSTIVVSRGLCDTLEDHELDAVLAHELAHVSNRDAAVMTALSAPVTQAVALFDADADPDSVRVVHPFVLLVAAPIYLLSRWSVAVVARYREYVADWGAVAITGDPAALASALETLDNELDHRPTEDLREHRSTAAFSIVPRPWEERRHFDRARRFVSRGIFGTHPKTETRIERLRSMTSMAASADD